MNRLYNEYVHEVYIGDTTSVRQRDHLHYEPGQASMELPAQYLCIHIHKDQKTTKDHMDVVGCLKEISSMGIVGVY